MDSYIISLIVVSIGSILLVLIVLSEIISNDELITMPKQKILKSLWNKVKPSPIRFDSNPRTPNNTSNVTTPKQSIPGTPKNDNAFDQETKRLAPLADLYARDKRAHSNRDPQLQDVERILTTIDVQVRFRPFVSLDSEPTKALRKTCETSIQVNKEEKGKVLAMVEKKALSDPVKNEASF